VDTNKPSAVIFGCQGLSLSVEEKRFFTEARPLGFILFERNCRDRAQVSALVSDLKDITGRNATPILIDQEGGRVQRLKPPEWRAAPTGAAFAALADQDMSLAEEAIALNSQIIAADLVELGITVNCAPVLDVPVPFAHDIIGDRALGLDPATVSALGRASAQGFLDGGVLPVIKHIPGHGRAGVDSHQELPLVEAGQADLEARDFAPFKALNDMPWAMTAHVVYTALDKDHPATTSAHIIAETVRGLLGFSGVLVSDDIGMKALQGSFEEKATGVLAAGCDLVLHCSGEMAEMEETAAGTGTVSAETSARLAKANSMLGNPVGFDAAAALNRLNEIL